MKKLFLLTLLVLGLPFTAVQAGDLTVVEEPGLIQCIRSYRSSMLDLSSPELNQAVQAKYDESLTVSETREVIYSKSQLYTWANETKVSCAKAIGFLDSGEVNGEQISQCDCFYTRMRLHMR